MNHLLRRILSDDPLIRAMSYQSVLSAFGEGAFLTGSAVYFTQVVGLSASQVGLGLTIAGIATFLVAVPLGKLADIVGTRRTWIIGAFCEALLFGSWLLIRGFIGYVAVILVLEVVQTWMRAGRNAYRFDVFPREARVRSLAYMRASRNVGYTLGALASGLALAADNNTLVRAVPVLTAIVLLLNTAWVTRLPHISSPAHAEQPDEAQPKRRSALHNRGFLLTSICDGVLATHGVLLNTVIPLWLVERTDAPRVLLAWLFGTNTVMAVLLQVAAARGVNDPKSSLRAERRGAFCFVLSCVIVAITHDTAGFLTIALVWLGHVTVTGTELFQSAGQWGLQAELSDPARRGEYQGVAQLGYTLGTVWAPAAYTFLAMNWGPSGWAVIAAVVLVAAVAIQPAARSAEHYLRSHAPTPERMTT